MRKRRSRETFRRIRGLRQRHHVSDDRRQRRNILGADEFGLMTWQTCKLQFLQGALLPEPTSSEAAPPTTLPTPPNHFHLSIPKNDACILSLVHISTILLTILILKHTIPFLLRVAMGIGHILCAMITSCTSYLTTTWAHRVAPPNTSAASSDVEYID